MTREENMRVRLNQYTTEYMSLEQEKETYYKEHINDMSRTTIVTLYQMQAYIDCIIKKICMLVGRFISKDLDVENECAQLVYDYYAPQIRRGLSNLL